MSRERGTDEIADGQGDATGEKAGASPAAQGGGDGAGDTARDRAIEDAQRLLRSRAEAVLCTISKRVTGWPFGSLAPYALSARGEPIILISTLAEHTKNIKADDRVSLFVLEPSKSGEVQAQGRITVMGRARPVPAAELSDARARYLARVPSAAAYGDFHDFEFFAVSMQEVRFIGGFGRIHWLEAGRLLLDPSLDPLREASAEIAAHMNADHADALVLYCRAFKNVQPARATMLGIDQYGFDLECAQPEIRLRFDFDEPVTSSGVRQRMVALVREARARLEGR